jgi:tetratricopeptide (TPR) repeat protein
MPLAITPSRARALGLAALVAALAPSPAARTAAGEGEKPRDVYTNSDVGRDPAPLSDVLGLYGATGADGCDAAARAVTAALLAGKLPESDEVAALLPAVSPCAARASTQEALGHWVDLAADAVRSRPRSGTADIARASALYRKGDFRGAAAAYRRALAAAPWHLDARNDLGLAELHAGNDAAAQLQLEVLHRLEPTYVPGLVNLTVVQERIGLRSQAEASAREAWKQRKEYPPAAYNAAWLANASGDYDRAAGLLAPVLSVKANPMHAQLQALNEKLRERERAATLLAEEFDDAKLGWKVWTNGEFYDAVFEGGSYVVRTKNEKCSLEVISPPFDAPQDFDLELRSVWRSGVENTAYGVVLGIDRDRNYHFAVSGNGQSVVWDSDANARDPAGWRAGTALVGDGTTANRQTVEVRGKRLLYLVNGHPIVAFESRYALSGRQWVVGVRVCKQETVAFDQLRIVRR